MPVSPERIREIEEQIRSLIQEVIPPATEMDLATLESAEWTTAPATQIGTAQIHRVVLVGSDGQVLTIFSGKDFKVKDYEKKAGPRENLDHLQGHYFHRDIIPVIDLKDFED